MNLRERRKKQIERAIFEGLPLLYSWFPPGTTREGPDPPDFIHDTGNGTIAIELMTLHHPSDAAGNTRQAAYADRRRIMRRAEQLAEAAGLPPLDVLVYFTGGNQVGHVTQTAKQIVDFVRTHPVERCETFEEEGIGIVRIAHSLAGVAVPHWTCGDGGSEPVLTYAQLATSIAAKNGDLSGYRETHKEAWLLLASTLFPLSMSFGIPDEIDAWTFTFDFDRVLLLAETAGKVFSLKKAA